MKNSLSSSLTDYLPNEKLFRFRGRVPIDVFYRLPALKGDRIHVCYQPGLTAHRGKLLSNSNRGSAVYAGCFLRKRHIVLEEQMLRTPRILERIFAHEVFHFVWYRLGTPLKLSFEELVRSEFDRRARGELGWSAESLKLQLTRQDREERTLLWKDYVCESFCDTAGWLFGGASRYSEMTLAKLFRHRRRRWFREHVIPRRLSI